MLGYLSLLLMVLLSSMLSQPVLADETSLSANKKEHTDKSAAQTIRIYKLVVSSNPIFDESAPDAIFIHNWANSVHINTLDSTILNKLNFTDGDEVSQKDLDEAQRNLRAEPYIRDAKITVTLPDSNSNSNSNSDSDSDSDGAGNAILIETWDNWSLLPTFGLSRSGGNNRFSIGIKEDNLLGHGIRTRISYKSDQDRTGFKMALDAPLNNFIRHSIVGVSHYDNSDGQASELYFIKPFYTLDAPDMYGFTYIDVLRSDTLRQNGVEINEFQVKNDFFNLTYGWRIDQIPNSRSRLIVGVTKNASKFDNLDTYPNSPLPQDRDFLYPWLAYESLQDDYKVITNVHLINYKEDFNLGWHNYFKLGLETKDTQGSNPIGYHLNWRTTRGYKIDNQLLLLSLDGIATLATSQDDFYRFDLAAEYFYQLSPKWTAYTRTRLSTSKNNYLDRPFALGDDTGIRGYPNNYQYGDNQWLVSAEIRNYPNINLYQLAELGWVAFVDVGQAFGSQDANNEVSTPIGSIGVGARIYSSRSSYGNVAHIDFSVPFTTGKEVDGWTWRLQVRNRF